MVFKGTFKAYREQLEKEGIGELTNENLSQRKDIGERWLEAMHSELVDWRETKIVTLSQYLVNEALKSSNYDLSLNEDDIIFTLIIEIKMITKILGDKVV